MENTTVPDANDLPSGWWVASSLEAGYDHRLLWGNGDVVYGDYIPQVELAEIVAEAREEAGLPDPDAEPEGYDPYWPY